VADIGVADIGVADIGVADIGVAGREFVGAEPPSPKGLPSRSRGRRRTEARGRGVPGRKRFHIDITNVRITENEGGRPSVQATGCRPCSDYLNV